MSKKIFWETIYKLAKIMKIPGNTYRPWKSRGSVPADWHYKLLKAAEKHGVELTLEDLNK